MLWWDNTRILRMKLDGAPATNQLVAYALYADGTVSTGGLAPPGTPSVVTTNSGTAVTLVGAPAAGPPTMVRWLTGLYLPNIDTAQRTVTLTVYDGSNSIEIAAFTLAVGDVLTTDALGNLVVRDRYGAAKGTNFPGGGSFAVGQVSVGNTATLIVAARAGRTSVVVTNTSTTAIYLGGSGVAASTGDFLAGIVGYGKKLYTTAAVYGITASGSETVTYEEEY